MEQISIEEKYRQQYAHFGRMNDILYRLPILFSTLIGGLWYFGFQAIGENELIARVVFAFTAMLSFVFILIIHRFNMAFCAYIDNLNKMDGEFSVTLRSSKCPSSTSLIQVSLAIAALLSLILLASRFCTASI